MNPLIKKEIRLLLPAWIAAMLLAIVPALIWRFFWVANRGPDAWESFNYLLSFDVPLMVAFGILCLGIASFGQEFSSNTFAVLLSQPAERRRLWTVKSNVLALASASVWLVAIILIAWQFDSLGEVKHDHFENQEISKWEALEFLTVSALAVGTGGLWTTLLLRQIAGAFWVTIFAPVAIVFGFGTVLGFFPITDQVINVITSLLLLGYSIAGFYWARRLFFRAQDAQWTGGNVLFPWRRKSVEQSSSFIRLPRNRFIALVWKEIRLHEVNLFIAAVLLAVHVAALVLHPFVSNRNTKMVLELVWSLWLLMPLLIGSAAVAEERRLGVLESQLCLPVSRRAQLLAKFFLGLILSVFLGAVAPSVIVRSPNFGVTDWPDFWIFYAAPVIFCISFYASSLARGLLHAIGIALVIPIVVACGIPVFFIMIVRPESLFYTGDITTTGMTILTIRLGLPLLLLILSVETLWNFKWLHENWKLWGRNVITLLVTLVSIFVLTRFIFSRPWERVMSLETPHGVPRLSISSPPKLLPGDSFISALLPDGRFWGEQIYVKNYCYWNPRILPALNTGRFIGSSNWVDIASDSYRVAGIQADGSLWSVSKPSVARADAYPLTRIGSDTNWFHVASRFPGFWLLKRDRTLWLWQSNSVSMSEDEIKTDLSIPPKLISPATNWTDFVYLFGTGGSYLRKNDGSLWLVQWAPHETIKGEWEQEWDEKLNLEFTRMPPRWQAFMCEAFAANSNWAAGVKTNGELWFFDGTNQVQLGQNAKWQGLTLTRDNLLIALRSDGTLWKWQSFWNWTKNPASIKPRRLGTYSDWIALRSGDWNTPSVALAADGSLWSWTEPSDRVWLAPSRRPVYMGNVLEGSP